MKLNKILKFDYFIAGSTAGMLFLGILILSGVSALTSQQNFGNTTYYLFHQLIAGIIPGVIAGITCYFLPIKNFKKWAWVAILINLLLMILVFIPGLGVVAGGAPRWINLKFFTLQPSEILKLTFILYIATWLSNPARSIGSKEKKEKTMLKEENFKYTFVPFLIIAAVITFLLAKQSDVSTLGVIIASGLAMYFCSNTPIWQNVLIVLIGLASGTALVATSSYRMMRLKIMLGLIKDPMGLGYQIKQILIGIGSGGIVGIGLGMSNQKFGFIPQTMSDSIFAIYSEETGFLGGLLLIFLLMLFLYRSLSIAKKTKDMFSKLFAVGFSSWICIQAFINIGAMIGIIPLTGIPLPFFSYGGSHIIAELAGVGILLNISRNT